jgi:hypothetical protein
MQLVIYDENNVVLDTMEVDRTVEVDGNNVVCGPNKRCGIVKSFGILPDGVTVNEGDTLTPELIGQFMDLSIFQSPLRQIMSQNAAILMALVQGNLI